MLKKLIIFSILFTLISCDYSTVSSNNSNDTILNNSNSLVEIPKIKIGFWKYNDYSKYIDYETLNIIRFGEVKEAKIRTSQGDPVNAGYSWIYTNENNDKIECMYDSNNPYKIKKINYIYDNLIWSREPIYSNDRIISISRWKYEHYMFFKNENFDETIHDSNNLIYEVEFPNDYQMLIEKDFSEEVASVLSQYKKNFYIEEASVQKAVRSNGEEYYSLYYGNNNEMSITYLDGVLNFTHSNGYKIIDNNSLNATYIFSDARLKISSYVESVVKKLAIDYASNPTNTDLPLSNKIYRVSNNSFKYKGKVGDNTFEIYYNYSFDNHRWQFYKFIFNDIDYSESVRP